MAKNLKLKIKNTQLNAALKLGKDLDKKKPAPKTKKAAAKPATPKKAVAVKKEKVAPPKKKPVVKIKKPQAKVKKEEPVVEEIVEETPVAPAAVVAEEPKPEPTPEPVKEPPKSRFQKPMIVSQPEEKKPKKEATKPAPKPATTKPPLKKPAEKKKEVPKAKRFQSMSSFDARDRTGLRVGEERRYGPRRRKGPKKVVNYAEVVRPKELKVQLPISVKDLASEMKLKAADIITKLFKQGLLLTINSEIEDETTVQLIGHEYDCEITLDTSEEERLRITGKTIQEEIITTNPDQLKARPPVVAFMGHVDHGKTSLIDTIRKSNITAKEAGAITQHIGAFRAFTTHGEITILDTPGHEAFTEMRARGATVTDLVILVVAGDEGMKPQTDEALSQAREAGVPVVVAINKSDKPDFDADTVYRQLSDRELLPEAWGGQTLTVNCSANTGEGLDTLLEMVLLQAEMLELHANPKERARGTILESELSRGFGPIATVLVQNGTLKKGDALVIDHFHGRVKTMHDERQKAVDHAGPSVAVKITGLSGLPSAGSEFIVVENEKEARKLCEERMAGFKRTALQKRTPAGFEELMERTQALQEKKILPIVLRADVQGSLEAVKNSLAKLPQKKIELNIISDGVGQISESDVELASASNAVIVGFHTQVESHAEPSIRASKLKVKLFDIIYHLVDGVKEIMVDMLDKIAEEKEVGEARVQAVFKSSQLGLIAGCQVTDGIVNRTNSIKQIRDGEIIWEGKMTSLKRVKEDIKEAAKGFECGILLSGQSDVQTGDILKAFEVIYHTQTLE